MKILISGLMGPGTLEAKVDPLAWIDCVDQIIFVRKQEGPSSPKVHYVILPSLARYKLFNVLLTPMVLWRQVVKYKPEFLIGYHVIPYGFFVAFTGLITKTPYIIAQTGLYIQRTTIKYSFIRAALKLIFRNAIQVNCPGNDSVRFWQSVYPEISTKFAILHSTVDTDYFLPDPDQEKFYTFIFLGRLAPVKNIDIIIRGFLMFLNNQSKHNDHKLLIVGDGPERSKLEQMVSILGLEEKILFTGFSYRPDKNLQQSRFLVMASESEGLPTAMMQAMASEVIPITNLVGNIPDLVQDGITGFAYKDCDARSIAEAMQRALDTHDTTLNNMKSKCRERIERKHSHNYAMSAWQQLFQRILNEK
jgi:glycosyltransferase involved in cell wall biosynthesis